MCFTNWKIIKKGIYMCKNEFIELKQKFKEISKMGYIESRGTGPSAAGKTFEDLIGKASDNLPLPDFKNVEIKTKLDMSKSYITLFNMTPRGNNKYEIKRITETYGYSDYLVPKKKIFQVSIQGDRLKIIKQNFLFKLKIDYKEEKIFLIILDRFLNIVEQDVYWTFDSLKVRLYDKIKYLTIVKTKSKFIDGKMHYQYYQLEAYKLKDFSTFLGLIEKGVIFVTFHVGVYRNGKRKGETHDRGTAFEIKNENLCMLFERVD